MMLSRPTYYLLLTAYCFLVSGCALIGTIKRPFVRATTASGTTLDDGYTDVAGVIHVHTTYSHDAHGTFEDVVRAANAQQLDYVITTEHNTLKPLFEGKQGWHGAVLVLIGTELSTQGGHYLAFNVTKEIDRHKLTTQQIIDEVARQGGLGFIAHPYFKKGRWKDWSVTGLTGIEAYNVAHDTLDENKLRLALWTLTVSPEPFYLSIIDRPYDPLTKWDQLIQEHGRVVGIGSVDAHEFHVWGLKFAPYEMMFQMVRTHLLVPTTPLTPELVYEALRHGHAYLEINLVADAQRSFTFFAHDGRQVLGLMGDEVPLTPHLQLSAHVPRVAQLTLFKDGQSVSTETTDVWQVPVTEPGAYRLEASLNGKPWLFSNPIYVRPTPAPSPPPETSPTLPESQALSTP
ncbi:MAG: CehA/McbA family metallohydrolase [Candidatus Omnitrophica bacterium]|nr:CehA/McbA family metallohydrolase [Candidatus Omnitrophota bacterium]